jgi:K+-sensing histidine kinase KdpD
MFLSLVDTNLSNHQKNILQIVFSAIVMKNQRLTHRQAEQELSSIRHERRTQYNFISGITHDLRNPLGCIKGYVTTLLRTDVDWPPETQQQFLEVINTESDHLEDMITNLLETARLQSGNYELNYQNTNLQTLLLEIQNTNKIKYPELTIYIDSASDMPFILADQKKLAQAFQNLVDNARKHAKIFEIWIKIVEENDGFLVHCEDHGEGIAEDRLKNIFERFSRTPEFSPGSHGVGLGLYISKQIVERHQGSIRVNSVPGTRTTFSIYLPKAPTQKRGKERG